MIIYLNTNLDIKKTKSTIDCIFILHSIIAKVLSVGKKLYTVFIDYEKCFDKINRTLLWQKLLSQNISSKMVNAVKAMYSTVKAAVKFNNHVSSTIDSYFGVKQGDPNSSLLFIMFVNDILENINVEIDGIFTIDEFRLFLLLFADDQALFSTTPEGLQSMLSSMYCNKWQMQINTAKTKVMIFEKSRNHSTHDFFLYGQKLEIVLSFKYLGMYLFKNGFWLRPQRKLAENASKSLHSLFTIFNKFDFIIKRNVIFLIL